MKLQERLVFAVFCGSPGAHTWAVFMLSQRTLTLKWLAGGEGQMLGVWASTGAPHNMFPEGVRAVNYGLPGCLCVGVDGVKRTGP